MRRYRAFLVATVFAALLLGLALPTTASQSASVAPVLGIFSGIINFFSSIFSGIAHALTGGHNTSTSLTTSASSTTSIAQTTSTSIPATTSTASNPSTTSVTPTSSTSIPATTTSSATSSSTTASSTQSTSTTASSTTTIAAQSATIQSIIGSNSTVLYQTLADMIHNRFTESMNQYNVTYSLKLTAGLDNQTLTKYYGNLSDISVNFASSGATGYAWFYLGPTNQYSCYTPSSTRYPPNLNYSCSGPSASQNISTSYSNYAPINEYLDFGASWMVMHVLGQRSVNGQACTMLSGTNTTYQSTLPGNLTIKLSTCVSNQYSIPLNFTVLDIFNYSNGQNGNSSQSMVLTSFSNHTTYAEVSGLPGPVLYR